MIALFTAWMIGTAGACEAVVAERLWTGVAADGVQDGGWHVAWGDDGRISSVAKGAPPAGCTVVAEGQDVTPGLIATTTHLGLVEIELEPGTRDDRYSSDPVQSAVFLADAYDPDSTVVPITRAGGVTAAVLQPDSGFVSAQLAAVSTASGTQADTVLVRSGGFVVNPDLGGSFAAGIARLGEILALVRTLSREDMFQGANHLDDEVSPSDLYALKAASTGDARLWFRVDHASGIEAVIRFAEIGRVTVGILGGAEAWRHADALAAARIPVVVDPLVYGPGGFDEVDARPDNALLLQAAGVPTVLTTHETHNARSLRYVAGNLARGRGAVERAQALAMITSQAAAAFGIPQRGTLKARQVADLVVWTGEPLEVTGRVAAVVIGGDVQDLSTRQTALVDAYRTLPKPFLPEPTP